MIKYLAFDISSILYRTFYANKSEDDITLAGLAMHQALVTLNKYFKKYKPDKVVMCFDRKAWRIDYTKSEKCIGGKVYKAQRRQNMTAKEREKYTLFIEHLSHFEELMKTHTSVICLAAEKLEADDLAAGFVQMYSDDNEIIVVSTDKDYIQLLGYPNTRLINPMDGKDRTLSEWDGDAKLFMFEKCVRGDTGDNVQSAFPRVRKTRIMKAYNDPLERVNMMNERWLNHEGKELIVKNVFKENELLMDLSKQPEKYRDLIKDTITEEMENPIKFSYFHFLKFCGKYDLKNVANNVSNFLKLLSS